VRNENQPLICCHTDRNKPAIVERMVGIVESDRKPIKELPSRPRRKKQHDIIGY